MLLSICYRYAHVSLPCLLLATVHAHALSVFNWLRRGTPHSPKLQHYWNVSVRLFSVISEHLLWVSFPSAEIQSVNSTAPAYWAMSRWESSINDSLIWDSKRVKVKVERYGAAYSPVLVFFVAFTQRHNFMAQSAGATAYTDCISADRLNPLPNEYPGYDTKQSHGELPLMLEPGRMRSNPSLSSLPGPHLPEVVEPNSFPIYGSNRTVNLC